MTLDELKKQCGGFALNEITGAIMKVYEDSSPPKTVFCNTQWFDKDFRDTFLFDKEEIDRSWSRMTWPEVMDRVLGYLANNTEFARKHYLFTWVTGW